MNNIKNLINYLSNMNDNLLFYLNIIIIELYFGISIFIYIYICIYEYIYNYFKILVNYNKGLFICFFLPLIINIERAYNYE